MEPEGSLLHSQEPFTGPYPEPILGFPVVSHFLALPPITYMRLLLPIRATCSS
jgi:hypothetical protein